MNMTSKIFNIGLLSAICLTGCQTQQKKVAVQSVEKIEYLDTTKSTVDRVKSLAHLDRNRTGGIVDQNFLSALDKAVQGLSKNNPLDELYTQSLRLVDSPLGKSHYADDLIYDLIIQTQFRQRICAPKSKIKGWTTPQPQKLTALINRLKGWHPDSPHLLAAQLIVSTNDKSSIRELATWVKTQDPDRLVHGPYLNPKNCNLFSFKKMKYKPYKLKTYIHSLAPLKGFTLVGTFLDVLSPLTESQEETWTWEAIRILQNHGAERLTLDRKAELAQLYYNLGARRQTKKNFAEALNFYRKSAKLDSKDTYTGLVNKMEFELAVASPPDSKSTKPDNSYIKRNILTDNIRARNYNFSGMKFYRKKEYKKAVDEFRKATQIDPNYGTAQFNLACTYSLMGDAYLAILNLEKALKLNPEYYTPKAKTDADFSKIRMSDEFKNILKSYAKR